MALQLEIIDKATERVKSKFLKSSATCIASKSPSFVNFSQDSLLRFKIGMYNTY